MTGYKVGYKAPPLNTRFKKGICPNPKGRGAAKTLPAGRIFADVQDGLVEVTEDGKKRRVRLMEAAIMRLARAAAKGDLKSAEQLLDIHNRSKTHGDYKHQPVTVTKREKSGADRYSITSDMTAREAQDVYNLLMQDMRSNKIDQAEAIELLAAMDAEMEATENP